MSNPPQPPTGTPPSAPPINIEFPANLPTQYANFALIMHTPGEIIVNFASIMPGMQSAPIHTRIVMTPLHAKMMLNALAENLQKFEAQFGEIKTPPGGPGLAEQFFGHTKPPTG
jgi:hypothetical protein